MKKILLVLVAFCVTFIATAQQSNVTIKKMSAKQVRQLIDTSTQPLIVNFWASWCGPCIREIPYFETQVKDKPVKLLLVSIDYPDAYPKQLMDFVKRKGYTSEIVYLDETDPKVFLPAIEKKWNGAIPASIFVNNKAKFYRFFDSQLTEQRLELELKNLLSGK